MGKFELITAWLNDMIDAEIEDVTGAIKNEGLWVLGSETLDEVDMHLENLQIQTEYIDVLLVIKEAINDANEVSKLFEELFG